MAARPTQSLDHGGDVSDMTLPRRRLGEQVARALLGKIRLYEYLPGERMPSEGELTEQDRLVYVDTVIKTKLLESRTLREQAASNTKEQFAASPDVDSELLGAVMAALDAHTTMSTQALNSDRVRAGLKDILLN